MTALRLSSSPCLWLASAVATHKYGHGIDMSVPCIASVSSSSAIVQAHEILVGTSALREEPSEPSSMDDMVLATSDGTFQLDRHIWPRRRENSHASSFYCQSSQIRTYRNSEGRRESSTMSVKSGSDPMYVPPVCSPRSVTTTVSLGVVDAGQNVNIQVDLGRPIVGAGLRFFAYTTSTIGRAYRTHISLTAAVTSSSCDVL